MQKFLLLASFSFFLTPVFSQTQKAPKWLEGTWEGTGYQPPTNSSWEIDLQYDAKKDSFSIGYPTLNCSGHWELLESKDNRLVFVEKITEGVGNCDNTVKVIVNYVDESYISVAYFLPGIFDNVVAHAVLKRKAKKVKKV